MSITYLTELCHIRLFKGDRLMSTFTLIHSETNKQNRDVYEIFESDIIDENLNYLSMYASIKVPLHEMHFIVSTLFTHGKTSITSLINMLSETKYDEIVLRQYVYVLMFQDIINFELSEPIHSETLIWVDEETNELAL